MSINWRLMAEQKTKYSTHRNVYKRIVYMMKSILFKDRLVLVNSTVSSNDDCYIYIFMLYVA